MTTGTGWETVATHEVFTVTGLVRVRLWCECTVDLTGGGTVQYGTATSTTDFIAATTATGIDAGEIWHTSTPADRALTSSVIFDYIINGTDIGFEVVTTAITAGTIVFHCVWDALNSTGNVTATAVGSTL